MASRKFAWSAKALACLLVVTVTGLAYAAPGGVAPVAVKSAPRLALTIGKSVILRSDADIARVSVAQPEVADFVLLSPRQVYVTGRAPGVTNLTLWDKGDKIRAVYDLDVAPDITRLKRMLHDVMPGEPGIEVLASQDSIALSGTVRDADNLKKALTLAEVYAPKKVLNLMSVGGVQQVMLEVRVAEMAKSVVNRMGINLNAVGDGNFAYTLIGSLSSVASGMFNVDSVQNAYQYLTITGSSGSGSGSSSSYTTAPIQLAYREFSPPTNKATMSMNQGTAVARWNTNWGGAGNTAMTAVLDLLKENGLVKILAEPNLVCLNGQSADFLAGGEIPVPVSAGLGTTSIEWKKFGVQLNFTPTLTGGDRINLKVSPEVSNLDYSRAITINGSTVPAINTRQTSTTIELKNGQTFAVAGLLSEQSRNSMDKYPVLGDIPVLGSLFKSSQYQKDQTELVILITAHLVKPLDKKSSVLPTDSAHEPDDLEFFLGITRDDASKASGAPLVAGAASLDGDFGHAVPVAAVGRPRSAQ
ncbi:type II and III secretion system protein family protein [Solidesulfovibrio sp.]|uniref:type II and III secretion system protein family protein n=1 Tax=Solidesulfovibrio sp. TaxID=2910990 RepID=UPI002B1F5AA1|nr:type II and III secretion system protein family protein [Solidesulfovibrio sp.]MEA5089659.1 type II and III secretion system protein family protein [Solidesulfovibrio sp.]HML62317.1 type II and III secretion system protein family protein [Solidesulfovibrio sp.]